MPEQVSDGKPTPKAAQIHLRVVELFLAGRQAEALTFIDPDVVDHRGGAQGDCVGLAAWKDKWEHMDDGDLERVSLTIEQNVASDDFSVNRYTFRGTHPASGRRAEVTGLDMVRVRDGKLVEHWALLDSAAIQHQIADVRGS